MEPKLPPRGRGRPHTTGTGRTIGVRLLPPVLEALDAWIARQPEPRPSRAEAVRANVIAGLGAGSAVSGAPGSELDQARAQVRALTVLNEALAQRVHGRLKPERPRRLSAEDRERLDLTFAWLEERDRS